MNLEQLKNELLKNEKFRKEYLKYDLAFEIGEKVIDARVKLGITQVELAKLVGTKQPSIARLENGKKLPSLSFLEKVAKSMGTYLLAPKFAFLEKDSKKDEINTNSVNNSFIAYVTAKAAYATDNIPAWPMHIDTGMSAMSVFSTESEIPYQEPEEDFLKFINNKPTNKYVQI